MKLGASRQLDRYPADLTTVDDKVVVLTSRDEGTFLEAYDAHLAPVWSKALGADAVVLLLVDRTPWVLDSEGAWACGDGGHCLARVKVSPREGMRLSAFGPVENGFVFAWQHEVRTPMRPPILERVNSDSATLWSVTLPVGSVGYEGVVQMRADEGWKTRPIDPWIPTSWFSTSRTLPVSGDAVVVCFADPRSGIGFGYVVSLTDGALRYTTQNGPIHEVAPIGEGAFLVGYQGYGAFETLQYDREGRVSERWSVMAYA
jgi:hypothetical protein